MWLCEVVVLRGYVKRATSAFLFFRLFSPFPYHSLLSLFFSRFVFDFLSVWRKLTIASIFPGRARGFARAL